ncbi:sulfur carrier protein ThiS [Actinocorallia populi]|uniref:sulfur carrier protein ThiS n=1 Tax=Actinocorallia populi TaxID=2079200 RepID=UPI000D0890E7|nr:sulfur carrier protein ThiS [Actinocorallia populi]
MRVTINGQEQDLPEDATVETAVTRFTAAGRGVAVAVNDEVVPRADWAATPVRNADRVEILTAVQGG